jgi:hypothetical protein
MGAIGELSEEMEAEYPIWRIWLAKNVPLNELRWEWTYEDILKANAMLDYQEAYDLAMEGMHPET